MNAPKYAADTWAIDSGDVLEIYRRGQFIKCLDATARFKISFDDGPETDFRKGLTFEPERMFSKVRIINTSAAAISVELAFGEGGILDNSLVLENSLDVALTPPDTLTDIVPVNVLAGATAQLVGENSARSEVLVRNLSATERVWVQGAASATARGMFIDGGEGLVLATQAAVHVYNPSGVAIDIAVIELEKSA